MTDISTIRLAHMLDPRRHGDHAELMEHLEAAGCQRMPWLHGRYWDATDDEIAAELEAACAGSPTYVPAYLDLERPFAEGISTAERERLVHFLELARRTQPRRPIAVYGLQHQPFYWLNPGMAIRVWHGLVEPAASALATSCYHRLGDLAEDRRRAHRLLGFYSRRLDERPLVVFVSPVHKATGELVGLEGWGAHLDMIRRQAAVPRAEPWLCWFGPPGPWWRAGGTLAELLPYIGALRQRGVKN